MIPDFYVQIIGYIATAFVLFSFISKDIILIRSLSLIGALIFTFYCAMKNDAILCFVNMAIAGINIFHLYKLTNKNGSN
jgi:hypothetical protein